MFLRDKLLWKTNNLTQVNYNIFFNCECIKTQLLQFKQKLNEFVSKM